jgi:hypothetical protein
MAGSFQRCRVNARQCIDLAADVEHPALKEMFVALADKWTSLAIKLEKARQQRRLSSARRTRRINKLGSGGARVPSVRGP